MYLTFQNSDTVIWINIDEQPFPVEKNFCCYKVLATTGSQIVVNGE